MLLRLIHPQFHLVGVTLRFLLTYEAILKKSLRKDLDITSNGRLLVYVQMTREPML